MTDDAGALYWSIIISNMFFLQLPTTLTNWTALLPVTQRTLSKLLTLMHGAVHANSPRDLVECVTAYVPYRSLLLLLHVSTHEITL